MKNNSLHYFTGLRKGFIYIRIAVHVAVRYLLRIKKMQWSCADYCIFLHRAFQLLMIFRHNKIIKVANGYKLHLYLPAYPSKAFFYAIESKLCRKPPAPVTIVFSITKACTYKCQHCYQRLDQTKELDQESMFETAKAIQDLGVSMFDIEGGEPFLRYPRLLELIKGLDDRSEIWVNTSGDGVNEERLLELKKQGLFGLMISIHSPEESKHDTFTGISGSFKKACEAVKLCHKLNLSPVINSVLSETEIVSGKLDDLMNLAKELNCDYVQLIHPKPSGKWLGHQEEMQRSPDVINQIIKAHKHYNSSKTEDFPSLAAQVFEESSNILGCTAGGVDRFYLNAAGELQPCEFLNISFGNVKEEGFTAVYQKMRAAFPIPCTDWLCCTKAAEIYHLFQDNQIKQTPLPKDITDEMVKKWHFDYPTLLYKKLGIYK